MFHSIKSVFHRQWQKLKRKNIQPLVSHHNDVKLLHRVHGKGLPKISQIVHLRKILSPNERLILRLGFLFFWIGIFWLGVNFVQAHRVEIPAVGGKYVEAVVGYPQFINPVYASTNDVDMDIAKLVFSGLMRYDQKNRLVPDLAVKPPDISEDKKIYTFELKKDVIWHDGESFTANDVVFTFDTMQNALVGSPLALAFQGVQVSALDDYTVRFVLNEPFAPFLSSLTVGIIPEHAWFDVLPEQMRLAQINIQPIGTGPFMFKKMAKDDTGHIYTYELERFDRFYREPAFIKDFVFEFFGEYENDTGAVQALRSQKVNGLNFVPKNLRDKVDRKHIVLHTLQLPQYSALFFNQDKNAVLKDNDVRLALAQAIDKDRILREALKGEGQVINSPILPGFIGYNPEVGKVDFSTDKANQLLDEEKWERISVEQYREKRKEILLKEWEANNPVVTSTSAEMVDEEELTDNEITSTTLRQEAEEDINQRLDEELGNAQTFYRQNKDGEILQINLVTVEADEYRQSAALLTGFWQEIGVKTNVKFVAPKNIMKEVLRSRDYDILLYGVIIGSDPDLYPFWHSNQIDYPGLNLARYVNRNADALMISIRETTEDEKLIDLYSKLQDLILSERPAIFLYMPTYTYATTDDVFGLGVTNISHPSDRLSDVTKWYMKTKGKWSF